MFVPKPATYISFESISVIVFSRIGGAVSASRTFDLTVTMKNGAGEHQFSNINREEQKPLEDFFQAKNLKTRNEMVDDSATLIAAALKDELSASDDEVVAPGADRGSADEDDESPDEDFQTESESDVAEEYDSAHDSSGGDSDAEMQDADGNTGGGPDDVEEQAEQQRKKEVAERPKKKLKTGK